MGRRSNMEHFMAEDNGGWSEYEKLVLSDLEGLKKDVKDMREELVRQGQEQIRMDTRLKMGAGVAGAAAGAISSIAVAGLAFLANALLKEKGWQLHAGSRSRSRQRT